MKHKAVTLTVILLMAGMLFIGGSCISKNKTEAVTPDSNIISAEVATKEEKAVAAPPPANKQEAVPVAAKTKFVKPHIKKIDVKGVTSPYCGGPSMIEEDTGDSLITCNLATEAEYPGGIVAWQRFLNRNLHYPEEFIETGIRDSIVVQFEVDKDGNVSNVEAVCGSMSLTNEAMRVIRKSGRWIPGRQIKDGRGVRSIKRQPFIFRVLEE
jgi:periplasmic protein TonB